MYSRRENEVDHLTPYAHSTLPYPSNFHYHHYFVNTDTNEFSASASLFSLRKAFTIVDLVKNASYKCGGCYMYNNFRGCDGGMILWNGTSSISVNGRVINRAKQFSLEEVEVTTATFDLEEIR